MRRSRRPHLALALTAAALVLASGFRPAAAIPDEPLEPKTTTTKKATTTTKKPTTTTTTTPPAPPPAPQLSPDLAVAVQFALPAGLTCEVPAWVPAAQRPVIQAQIDGARNELRTAFARLFGMHEASVGATCVGTSFRVGTYQPGKAHLLTANLSALNILNPGQTFAAAISERTIQAKIGEQLGSLPRNFGDFSLFWAFADVVGSNEITIEAQGEAYVPWYIPIPDHSADFDLHLRDGVTTNAGRPTCWQTWDVDLHGLNSAADGYAEDKIRERINSGQLPTPGCFIAKMLAADEARYLRPPAAANAGAGVVYELRYNSVRHLSDALVLGGTYVGVQKPVTVNLVVPTAAVAPLEGTTSRAEVYVTGGVGGGVGPVTPTWSTPGGTLASGPRVIYDIPNPRDGQVLTRQITLTGRDSLGQEQSVTRTVTIVVRQFAEPRPLPPKAELD